MQPIPFTAASLESLCEKVSGTLKLQRFQTPFRTGSEELVYAIPQKRPSSSDKVGAQPAVTVAVSHYNLGRFLPETLASLARQTCTDLEVLVLDDGSTCADPYEFGANRRAFIRNSALSASPTSASGRPAIAHSTKRTASFSFPWTRITSPLPTMVEGFLRGMRSRPDLSAMTCFFAAFENKDDISHGEFLHQYCPTGGPHLAACAFNVYGDANAIFRTEHLRSVGGFVTDRATYCHDWETFVKLIHAGRSIGVIPEYLFYYRRRADGMSADDDQRRRQHLSLHSADDNEFCRRKWRRIDCGSADALGGIGELFPPQ